MKSLKEFIMEERLKECADLHWYENFFLDILENTEEEIDKGTVGCLMDSIYLGEDRFVGYDWWQDYLYEMLNNIVNTIELKEKIEKKFSKYIEEIIIINTGGEYRMIRMDLKNLSILDNEDFIHLCNFSHYEIIVSKEVENRIHLKPIKGKDISDKVHSYKYIYHITQKHIYDEYIKKKGIIPKAGENSVIERVYFSPKYDDVKARTFAYSKFRQIKNEGNSYKINNARKGYVVLKIKVDKIDKRIKFFEDSGSNGNFWTLEYIPPYTIESAEDIDLSIYKDELLNKN